MPDVVSPAARASSGMAARFARFAARARSESPSLTECGAALVSAVLLIISFPDFNLWPLAWIALVPLLMVVARTLQSSRNFLLGWLFGSTFFYGSCHWLTYSMIHTGGISPPLAYLILLPGAVVMGIFPGLFAAILSRSIRRWGTRVLFMAPLYWAVIEWLRLEVTGQLWNAIGYSQAFQPRLIQAAGWGGVYAVGFLIVLVNAAVAYLLLRRDLNALKVSVFATTGACVVALVLTNLLVSLDGFVTDSETAALVIAIQPNVPMDLVKTNDEMAQLAERHFQMSRAALKEAPEKEKPRLLVWPESPMNFTYGTDGLLRERLAQFAIAEHTSILLNSQEVAPNDGIYNSALLINDQGNVVAQYDKIRLLPFGEYVPLPHWLPGAGLIGAIVGEFTPGTNYRLMSVGHLRAGVFICIESAYPSIAGRFTRDGADVLINISNDGYLGPTAVMQQHLANAVFRAVENNRAVLRVTNTGITSFITSEGVVKDPTQPFQQDIRIWRIERNITKPSFYARHGDVFVAICGLLSIGVFVLELRRRTRKKTST